MLGYLSLDIICSLERCLSPAHVGGIVLARGVVRTALATLVALSFPRASLSENCSLLGTDNVRGQISEHIFAPNGDYCLFIIQQIEHYPNMVMMLSISVIRR